MVMKAKSKNRTIPRREPAAKRKPNGTAAPNGHVRALLRRKPTKKERSEFDRWLYDTMSGADSYKDI